MDPSLRKLRVSTMAEVDDAFADENPEMVQLHVEERSAVSDVVQIGHRMQAGIKANDALQVFNPELVVRKMEAEMALREAIEKITIAIAKADEAIAETQEELVAVQREHARGPDVVRVGPSISRRAVDRDQVVFPTVSWMPDEGVAPKRRMPLTSRLRSRGWDAASQMDFWDWNLIALQRKETLQTAYRDGLVQLREEVAERALEQPTYIGAGFTNYYFRF